MVQHTPSISAYKDEVNEFQLVHAIITQSIKSFHEICNENDLGCVPLNLCYPQHKEVVSTIFQSTEPTIQSSTNSAKRRNVPDCVKNFLSHFRKPCSSKAKVQAECKAVDKAFDDRDITNHSTLICRPSNYVQLCTKAAEKVEDDSDKLSESDIVDTITSSNVRRKVQHFEQCANQLWNANTNRDSQVSLPEQEGDETEQDETLPSVNSPCPPPDASSRVQPPLNPSSNSDDSPNPHSPSSSSDGDGGGGGGTTDANSNSNSMVSSGPYLTGRNLKRTPSARFQKIRKKVQKLMQPSPRSTEPTESSTDCDVSGDESSYLDSIRIPLPSSTQSLEDYNKQTCLILRLPDHVLRRVFSYLDTRDLANVKCTCFDFNFIVNYFDVRAKDSKWTADERYIDDPCKQCRQQFTRGDMSMCRYHPKRYYADLPYGRSYWMCCLKPHRNSLGCQIGIHDNNWVGSTSSNDA